MTITIRTQNLGGDLKDFLKVVDRIYANDAKYVRPLDLDVSQRLSPKHPYFQHASAAIFTAYRHGTCVGRVVAHRNDLHLARYNDGTGFFGFLDTVDDAEVCRTLLQHVGEWHASRGLRRIRGPITLNMAEEVGCLVDGFDTPPMLLMGHHRPYQGRLLEASDLVKAKDAYAWRYTTGNIPPRARRAHESIKSLPEVTLRRVDMKNLERDVAQMLDIYNDAWGESWGYVPLTPAEASRTASEFRLVANPALTCIVDIEGVPSAFAYALPNLNEAIAPLGGKLLTRGLLKAVWDIKVKGLKTARLVGLGLRRSLRNQRKYAGLSAFLYAELNAAGMRENVKWGELSYTLEDNGPMNAGIKLMGGVLYKTYRVFEKQL
ncbi:MAG: hypothetical protein ABI488_07225 [Polyangiaceae bacterium]